MLWIHNKCFFLCSLSREACVKSGVTTYPSSNCIRKRFQKLLSFIQCDKHYSFIFHIFFFSFTYCNAWFWLSSCKNRFSIRVEKTPKKKQLLCTLHFLHRWAVLESKIYFKSFFALLFPYFLVCLPKIKGAPWGAAWQLTVCVEWLMLYKSFLLWQFVFSRPKTTKMRSSETYRRGGEVGGRSEGPNKLKNVS